MELTYWYLSVVTSSVLSFGIGFQFVAILRKKCKTLRNIRGFTTSIFATPLIIYLLLNLLTFLGWTNRTISDAISFGIVFGILLQLARKPRGPGSIKLTAKQIDGKHVDVWLDSLSVPAGEIRNRIADALGVTVGRVFLESGKGNFIEDMDQPIFENIEDTLKQTDFFGYLTVCCYIFVKEEEKKKQSVADAGEGGLTEHKDKKSFLGLLGKPEIKYGEFLVCSAKIATSVDAKVNFQISCVDRFVAGAPSTLLHNSTTIRLHPWSQKQLEDGNDNVSDAGESVSVSSRGPVHLKKRSSIFFRQQKGEALEYFGKPLRHGDIVVLETNGKYMSVTRGWWMAWHSNEPRRSGAFRIEIVEKAQNQLKEQFKNIRENIKEKMASLTTPRNADAEKEKDKEKEFDPILRPGDLLRLKSVKFPDFELGLTSVKIRDEFCYLGLRKTGSTDVPSGDDAWCMEVNFAFRNANDILNIIANK